jgi:uncharacterized RDD family membrane protein YckC
MEARPDPRDVALGLAVTTVRAAAAASRIALRPARALGAPLLGRPAARAVQTLAAEGRAAQARARARLESLGADVVASPEVARTVDRVLEGPLPDTAARSVAEHQVVERLARPLLESGGVEAALASPELERVATEVADSRVTGRTMEQVLRRPEIRDALVDQSLSLVDEVGDVVRRRGRRADDRVEALVHGRRRARGTEQTFAGIATRAAAFVIDLALAGGIVLVASASIGLISSLVSDLDLGWLAAFLAAFGWTLAVGAYFVAFWSLVGRTPGMQLLQIRVAGPTGGPPGVGASMLRYAGLLLAIAPLFLGFLPVLFDRRRRGLQDFVAGTAVVYAEADAALVLAAASSAPSRSTTASA